MPVPSVKPWPALPGGAARPLVMLDDVGGDGAFVAPATSSTAVTSCFRRPQEGIEEAGTLLQPLESFTDTFWSMRAPPAHGASGAERVTIVSLGSDDEGSETEGGKSSGEEFPHLIVAADPPDASVLSSPTPTRNFAARLRRLQSRELQCREMCDCGQCDCGHRLQHLTQRRACGHQRGRPSPAKSTQDLASFGIERDLELGGPGWVKSAIDLQPHKSVFFPDPPEYACPHVYHTGHHLKSQRRRWQQANPEGLTIALSGARDGQPSRVAATLAALKVRHGHTVMRARSCPSDSVFEDSLWVEVVPDREISDCEIDDLDCPDERPAFPPVTKLCKL